MKVKKIIATIMAAVTLAVPFNGVTASAEGFDPTGKETTNLRYFNYEFSVPFNVTPSNPAFTDNFYWNGSSLRYAAFNRTNYGKVNVSLYKIGYGLTEINFVIDNYPKPTQYVSLCSNLGAGTYCFLITCEANADGSFSVGHY